MAEVSISSRLLGNSTWNAAAFATSAGLNLLVLPFVLRHLGIAAFGMAGLVTASISPALIFSNTLRLAASREFALSLSPERISEARQVFSSALLLAMGVGGLIVSALVLGGPPIASKIFNFTAETSQDLVLAFAYSSVGWLCQCLSSVFMSLFIARQDYARASSINIFSTIVATGAMLVLIPLRPMASTFLACQALNYLTVLVVSSLISVGNMTEWLALPAFRQAAMSSLVKFGFWQMIAQGGGLVTGQADRYLLGILLPPQFAGFYVIAQRLEEAIYIGIMRVGEILFPFFSVLQEETSDHKVNLFFRASWILNLLAASALGGLIPLAGPLLNLWTGAEVANEAQHLLVVLSIAGILGCAANVFAFYLLADGKSRANALIAMVTAVCTLTTSCLTLPHFGWTATGWSATMGMLAQIAATFWTVRKTFGQTAIRSRFVHFVLLPLLTGIVTALLLRHFLSDELFHSVHHWWYIGILYGLFASAAFIAVVAVSQFGPYGATTRRDLGSIVQRFSPMRVR